MLVDQLQLKVKMKGSKSPPYPIFIDPSALVKKYSIR